MKTWEEITDAMDVLMRASEENGFTFVAAIKHPCANIPSKYVGCGHVESAFGLIGLMNARWTKELEKCHVQPAQ